MNNFIVGQVTPDLIESISYGTYLLFGILTILGAGFVWFYVPETKRLTLEEMDVVFGSEGTAEKDMRRMEDVRRELGLDLILGGSDSGDGARETGNSKGAGVIDTEKRE